MMATAALGRSSLRRPTLAAVARRIGKVKRTDSNDGIQHDAKHALEVVGLSVAQERSNDEHGKEECDRIEYGKVVVHRDFQAPANQDNERCVEQGGLDRGAHDVGESHVDLIVVGLVDSKKMLYTNMLDNGCQSMQSTIHTGNLFHQGHQNEPNEGIADTSLNNSLDILYQEDGQQGDTGQSNEKCQHDLG
jgi:hypothetical protein